MLAAKSVRPLIWTLYHHLMNDTEETKAKVIEESSHYVKILESDSFGVISYVLPCFRKMHNTIHSLLPVLNDCIDSYDEASHIVVYRHT